MKAELTTVAVEPLALSVAAAKAASVHPADVLRDWFSTSLRSEHSRRTYLLGMARFVQWLTGKEFPIAERAKAADVAMRWLLLQERVATSLPARAVVRNTLLGFRTYLAEQGISSGSQAAYLASVTGLISALHAAGLLSFTVCKVSPRIEHADRSGPREADVGRVLDTLDDKTTPQSVRDAAVVRLGFNELLRRGEIVGLDVQHLQQTDAGTVLLVHGKGRQTREPVALNEATVAALHRWLDVRGRHPGPLFVRVRRGGIISPTADRLTGQSVAVIVQRAAKHAGVKYRVRAHGLRHAGATACLRHGGTLDELKAAGRWKSLSAPSRYIDDAQGSRLRAVARFAR